MAKSHTWLDELSWTACAVTLLGSNTVVAGAVVFAKQGISHHFRVWTPQGVLGDLITIGTVFLATVPLTLAVMLITGGVRNRSGTYLVGGAATIPVGAAIIVASHLVGQLIGQYFRLERPLPPFNPNGNVIVVAWRVLRGYREAYGRVLFAQSIIVGVFLGLNAPWKRRNLARLTPLPVGGSGTPSTANPSAAEGGQNEG